MKVQTGYTIGGMLLIGYCILFLTGLLWVSIEVHNHTESAAPVFQELSETLQSLRRVRGIGRNS